MHGRTLGLHANVFARTPSTMTRSELIRSIREAEKEANAANKRLAALRQIVETVTKMTGDLDTDLTEEATKRLPILLKGPKHSLKVWAYICSHDPLLAYVISSRKNYRQTDTHRGKSARPLENVVSYTYIEAGYRGFKGSRNQWEHLLRMRP